MKKVGDKQQAICYNCSELTQSTFARRDVSLSGTDVVAKKNFGGLVRRLRVDYGASAAIR